MYEYSEFLNKSVEVTPVGADVNSVPQPKPKEPATIEVDANNGAYIELGVPKHGFRQDF
jgi:hypothetical protein